MTLPAGRKLGPYEILSPLGAGGMGEVYRAIHLKLGREVAIKVLPSDLAFKPDRLKRFEREARSASALNHPNIVIIYDIAEYDGVSFIAMELVEGRTLREHLKGGSFPVDKAIDLAIQVTAGLAKAHESGIVHRDLKPDNLMVTSDGLVKILDFGLAKLAPYGEADDTTSMTTLSKATMPGVALGTVPYMSPEQAAGRSVDHRSDQFSLGIIIYELLCGRRPFRGDSMAAVLSAILRDTPPSPRTLRAETPREIERVVSRCLEKDPEKRYASTGELSKALHRYREGAATPAGLTLNRRTVAAAFVLLIVIGAGVGLFWLRHDLVRWMERDKLAEITRLSEAGDLYEAFRLTREVQDKIPDDPEIRKMIDRITIPISIITEPPGADVFMKAYASQDAPWVRLGDTPLEGVRVPYALTHWKISKEGFETFEGAPFGVRPFMAFAQGFTLEPVGSRPGGMVRVPGGPFMHDMFPPIELGTYWLDRYEVTNRQFKEFSDAGGYTKEEYWTEPFIENGRELTHEEALAQLIDSTGRPGPARWEFGAYNEGEADFPVGGVSWYEAAAYCRFVGKNLPTLYHWYGATAQDQLSDIIRVSNFGNEGPAPVGSHPGLGDFGTYDMAGNVKEWCWNEAEAGRYILGGSWGEPTYTFRIDSDMRPPLSREPTHGFRCARFDDPLNEALTEPLKVTHEAFATEPASEEIFEAYCRIYAYDRTDLEATVDSVDDSPVHWRKEKVSYKTAYGDERVIAHLFLPRNAEPPYQPVIWFPGNDAFFLPAGEALASPYLFDFIPRSGRALIYPVYKGMYERHVPFSFSPNEWRDMIVMWSKDVGRTVDYLEERSDIDMGKLAYYGFSSGAGYGPIFTAVDKRFKASVLLAGGLYSGMPPEADMVNFAPRSSVPTLMVNGENDFLNPFEASQKPLFELLGAPEDKKRHARLDGGHIPPDRLAIIREVIGWLNRQLGPVEAPTNGL